MYSVRMNRDRLVRFCALREKAADALQAAREHLFDMATLSLGNDPLMHTLATSMEAVDDSLKTLRLAKEAALRTVRDAA